MPDENYAPHQRAGKRRYPRARPTSMTTVVTTPVTIKLICSMNQQ